MLRVKWCPNLADLDLLFLALLDDDLILRIEIMLHKCYILFPITYKPVLLRLVLIHSLQLKLRPCYVFDFGVV